MPRTRCSAINAFTRVFDALWRCAADPGPFQMPEFDAAVRASNRFFVCILANRPRGVLYVGVTNNLLRRIQEHMAKLVPGFTRSYGIVNLVYYEEYASIHEARSREHALKRWRRSWKLDLVESLNPNWRDLSYDLAL